MGLASKLRKNQPQPPAAQPPPAPMGYGATQSATTDSFRGNHPSAPPYGAAPPPGGQSYGAQQQYGAAPPSGGYGAQATGGYGGAPPAGGYGAPPAGGYGGAQRPTGGYGGAQGAGGYGGAGGYNAAGAPQYGTQSTGGYGGAQGAGGYGGAPPATGGYGGAPGGYGAPQFGNSQGGYPGGGGYGNDFGAAPAPGGDARIYNVLKRCVDENRLQRMYTDERLRHLSSQLLSLVPRIQAMAARWRISDEVMYDLFKIALYDVHLLCDDSGSMIFQENGERINDLKVAISYVAECCSIFDLDGIQVRFLNSTVKGDHITDGAQVEKLISEVRFSGVTPIGTALENAILRPYFYEPMRQNTLQKPLLVICITDGSPAGEPADAIFKAIRQTAVYHTSLGKAVAFSFAQVGNDQDAQKFLQTLDKHPEIGECVDVTSNYELEETELARKGAVLTPEMWIAKLLLGPIDASYDRLDE